jgi:hypothetical protein
MIAAITEFSTNNRTPTLWLYARNDPIFRPEFVFLMHDAWIGQGTADLRMLPTYEPNGHRMFIEEEGVETLLPEIDDFLRTNGLPTWEPAAIIGLEKEFSKKKRAATLSKFLSAKVSHKVLATTLDDTDVYFWKSDSSSVEAARVEVLESCRQFSGTECAVVLEDFTPQVTTDTLKAMKVAVRDKNKGVTRHASEENGSNGLNCDGAAGEAGGNCGSNNVGNN